MKHWEHHPTPVDGCFGCKGLGLQMNSGDAKRDISDKKWTSELQAYRDARAQGIQPAGTTMRHVQEAHRASEVLGKAYNFIYSFTFSLYFSESFKSNLAASPFRGSVGFGYRSN